MQRLRQLLVRIHDREFRCRNKQFVVGTFDLIDIVIGRVNLLERFDRLPHRLPRLLIEIDGAVLLGFESTDDLVKVDVDIVRNRALEIRRKGVPDQTPVSRVDYRAEELRERQVPHGSTLDRLVRRRHSRKRIAERQRVRREGLPFLRAQRVHMQAEVDQEPQLRPSPNTKRRSTVESPHTSH